MSNDSLWYYCNGDPSSSPIIGPAGEMQIAEAIRKGTIDSQTQLRHVRITEDRWLPLSALDFNAALTKYDQAESARREQEKIEALKRAAEKRQAEETLWDREAEKLIAEAELRTAENSTGDYFTGLQMIATGLIFSVVGVLLGVIVRRSPELVIVVLVAIGLTTAGGLFLLAGAIRWAIQPLIDYQQEVRSRRNRSARKTATKKKPKNLLSDPDRW